MSGSEPSFDIFSEQYEALLRDPIRDKFSHGTSEFFHLRKCDLIRSYFRRRQTNTRMLSYLDLGCGRGDLLRRLRGEFADVSGCDPSPRMIESGGLAGSGVRVQVQDKPGLIPFPNAQFDFVTAVCVYHHVPPAEREGLAAEAARVLRPGGIFAIIEHNPYNPLTRLIVSRTPVDKDAILLRMSAARGLLRQSGFAVDHQEYFLYLPEQVYGGLKRLESALAWLPLGGQYAVFGKKPA